MFGLVFAQGVCVMRYWVTPLFAVVKQQNELCKVLCARVMMVSCFYLPIGLIKPTQEA